MAQVRVPAQWFAQGVLPRICARHGGPSTGMTSRTMYTASPLWILILFLFAALIAVIVAIAIRGTIEGRLPGCASCAVDRRRFVNRRRAGWAVVVSLPLAAAGLGAIGVEGGALLALMFLAIPAALVFSCCGDLFRERGHLSKDRMWVELKGVSPEFARTIDGALRSIPPLPMQGAPPAGAPLLGTRALPFGSAPPPPSR